MRAAGFLIFLFIAISCESNSTKAPGTLEIVHDSTTVDSIDEESGFINDPNLPIVLASCTGCHSAKLVTQNRATREGWKNIIVWMQETQKLWDLGENERIILDYLEKNYSPEFTATRRSNLQVEWYELED